MERLHGSSAEPRGTAPDVQEVELPVNLEDVSAACEVLRLRFAWDGAGGVAQALRAGVGEDASGACSSPGGEDPQEPAEENKVWGSKLLNITRSWADDDLDSDARRRAANAARNARRRASESSEERARRKAENAARAARNRAQEGPEKRAQRLAAQAARAKRRRAEEDPEKRAKRLAVDAARAAWKRATEDPEARAKRLAIQAARAAQRRAEEDPEKRAKRLAADAARAARRRRAASQEPSQHLTEGSVLREAGDEADADLDQEQQQQQWRRDVEVADEERGIFLSPGVSPLSARGPHSAELDSSGNAAPPWGHASLSALAQACVDGLGPEPEDAACEGSELAASGQLDAVVGVVGDAGGEGASATARQQHGGACNSTADS